MHFQLHVPLALPQEYHFLPYTRPGEVARGEVRVGRGCCPNSLEFKHCKFYKKIFYHVNTLLGRLAEPCKGPVQMRDPKDSGSISFIVDLSLVYLFCGLGTSPAPPKSLVNMGSAGRYLNTGPTPSPRSLV